ncbi:hypothetical protein BGP77_02540 [Saccharospirillum sp. MSK14-1]|nr:hypothetical protein BGP77_02540 [Saccharospirillum sp. MSK14-1]
MYRFALSAGPLANSLDAFAALTDWQVGYSTELAQGHLAPAVNGDMTAASALQLLLSGTGLSFEFRGGNTVVLVQQNSSGDSSVLPAVVVRGDVDPPERVFDEGAGTSVVGREAMDRTGPRHASEILQATAGVLTATNEQNPSVSVNIRGLKDFGRVNMNIDGMRQNYQRSGHGQRNGEMFFDPEFLNEVEIQKGAYAGAGGAGVTGGVATFTTLDAEDLLDNGERFGGRVRATTGVGDWGNGQQPSGSTLLALRPSADTELLLGYSVQRSESYRPGQNGQAVYWGQSEDLYPDASVNVVEATDQQAHSWLAEGSWYLGDDLTLKLTALGSAMAYGESQSINSAMLEDAGYYDQYCDPPISDYWANHELCQSDPGDEALYQVSNDNRTLTQNYALDTHYNPVGGAIDLSTKLYWVSTKNDSASTLNEYTLTTRTDTLGAVVQNRSALELGAHWLDFNYGVEAFRDANQPDVDSYQLTASQSQALADATPQGQRLLVGTWLASDWEYQRLTLSPALRWEAYRLWGETGFNDQDDRPDSDDQGETLWQFQHFDVDRNDTAFLPSLGAAFDVIDGRRQQLQLFANAGLSWRPPQITETLTSSAVPFHSPPVVTIPNWRLEPERTTSWEAGFNVSLSSEDEQKRFNLKLNQFYNRTEHYIDYVMFVNRPGDVGQPPVSAPSAYANALNDRIFLGQELQLDFQWRRFYGGLNVTHTEQRANPGSPFNESDHALVFPAWPLGGPEGQSPDSYCPDPDGDYDTDGTYQGVCAVGGNLYAPPVPEWTGRLTLGTRLLQRRLDLGLNLTCASQTGDYRYQDGEESGEKIGLAEYCVLDQYGTYQWGDSLRLGYHLKNVTDREYIQAMGDGVVKTYAPGRTLTANVQWTF